MIRLPKVSCKYGAPMGRTDLNHHLDGDHKFHLHQVAMSSDGAYDTGGAYWGIGAPLYFAYNEGEEVTEEMYVRSASRSGSKEQVRRIYPNARFYR